MKRITHLIGHTDNLVRHGLYFFLLLLIISSGLAGILYFRFDPASQIAIVVIMSILYVFWGIFHHFADRDLTFKVIGEYVAMASLVAFMLMVFLLRV